ncbi:MAG: transcriptional regulator [Marmoricola sp.]|nr:transcriptional regulator [Marmoricola sp.]
MYVPRFNVMGDPGVRALVDSVGSAELITVGAEGYPVSTLLPVVWHDQRLVLHMARANPHWQSIAPGTPALAVVTGPQAYVSPAWYPSAEEHGRVVPTWNYTAVHFTGRVEVHQEEDWLRDAVTRLTDLNERPRARPWSVDQAPDKFIEQQLRAIVGIELTIEKVEGKAKLSQNRSAEDHAGVVAGLRREGGTREHEVADRMEPG